MILLKFWMHLSQEEQLKRFRSRAKDELRRWKLTDEDWRNRGRRAEYELAVAAMLERTDHECARWTVIPGDSKRYARVAVLEAVIAAIERGMRANGQEPLSIGA
jgi:polyphosphate kinase 2 (PPK2 family)